MDEDFEQIIQALIVAVACVVVAGLLVYVVARAYS